MPQEYDPYHRWLGIPPEEQPADHYRLLGLVRFENDIEVIRDAAERQIAHVRRYGIGKHSDLSQRILNELAGAKAVLLDPEEKPRYDARLRSEIESPENRALDEPVRHPEPAVNERIAGRKPESAQNDGTQVCQPTTALPTAILWILDDGQRTGQSVRMRRFPFLVGRTQGHVRIPHDAAIDDPHLEISWQADGLTRQLVVRDVGRPFQAVQDDQERPSCPGSCGGLFVRAVKARIRVGQEIRIGSGCYRLVEPSVLEEVSPQTGRRLTLGQPVVWLGRTPECEPLHVSQDRMADHRHAKVSQDGDAWSIEDQGALNGMWLRVPQVVVRSRAEILIGEQAMVIDIPRFARR